MNEKRVKLIRHLCKDFGLTDKWVVKRIRKLAERYNITSTFALAQFCENIAGELRKMQEPSKGDNK